MADLHTRYDELIDSLKQHDFRLTPQRVELVRLIADSHEHPSALQLYEKIKVRFPTISQATVYKTLALLKEIGQVLEVDLRDYCHYDGHRPKPHPHLVCTHCNKIIDGEIDIDLSLVERLEEISGYEITRSQFVFYGLCPNCRQSKY